MTKYDLIYVAPILMLAVSGLIVLIVGTITDRFPKGRLNHWFPPEFLSIELMILTVGLAVAALRMTIRHDPMAFFELMPSRNPLLLIDPFAAFMGLIAVVGTLVVVVLSLEYFGDHNTRHRGEYYTLLFFATSAILLVAASTDLLMIYLSLEFLSLSSYVLAAYWKNDEKSSEAGIKYFLFGAVSSAVMLYGMSMLYGLTNSTNLDAIASTLASGNLAGASSAVLGAVLMVLVGLGFKLALVPFHLWAPDTYEGAPTPITAWLSVASKAAGLAVVTRFLLVAIPQSAGIDWYTIILVLSAVSMTLGNMVAITQKNIKRMLAYSSIAQVGYMLVGVLAAAAAITPNSFGSAISVGYLAVSGENLGTSNYGLAGLLIYAASYLFMNLGAFAVVIAVERRTGSSDIEAFARLGKRAPFLAASLVVFFLSLAGIPPTAGFIGKFYVFAGAIQTARTDLLVLALIAVANSVISVYYYFNVTRWMYFDKTEPGQSPEDSSSKQRIYTSFPTMATVVLMLVFTIAIGCILAAPVIKLAQSVVL